MDVFEYFASRERECREMSLHPESDFADFCAAEAGSNDQRGIIFGRFALNKRAFLAIYESVVVVGSGVHRLEYSYYLIVDGYEAFGYDRDPSHTPSEHRHEGADHTRHPCARVTFCEVAEKAWEYVSDLEPAIP